MEDINLGKNGRDVLRDINYFYNHTDYGPKVAQDFCDRYNDEREKQGNRLNTRAWEIGAAIMREAKTISR